MKLLYLLVPIFLVGIVSGYVLPATTFGGNVTMNSHNIVGLAEPSLDTDAATKGYVDGFVSDSIDDIPDNSLYVPIGPGATVSEINAVLAANRYVHIIGPNTIDYCLFPAAGNRIIMDGELIETTDAAAVVILDDDVRWDGGYINCSAQGGNGDGFYIEGADECIIQNVTVYKPARYGIVAYGLDTSNISIVDSCVINSTSVGIMLSNSGSVEAINNHVLDSGTSGISVWCYEGNRIRIRDNLISGSWFAGITHDSDATRDQMVSDVGNNIILNTIREAILIIHSAHVDIHDNFARDVNGSSVDFGITIDQSNHCRIVDNDVSGYALAGIDVAASSFNIISGNTVYNCGELDALDTYTTHGILVQDYLSNSRFNNIVNNNIYSNLSPTTYAISEVEWNGGDSDYNMFVYNNIYGYGSVSQSVIGAHSINVTGVVYDP